MFEDTSRFYTISVVSCDPLTQLSPIPTDLTRPSVPYNPQPHNHTTISATRYQPQSDISHTTLCTSAISPSTQILHHGKHRPNVARIARQLTKNSDHLNHLLRPELIDFPLLYTHIDLIVAARHILSLLEQDFIS